ncbi:hypothetical protein WAZ07_23065 [Bacillus sp. FJAT-51639]|uniref:Uncharacterized protein n=1 Tax=Bacillus bruguierae TaxID=3127667 RepID=A0ABU8FMW5_9BACI
MIEFQKLSIFELFPAVDEACCVVKLKGCIAKIRLGERRFYGVKKVAFFR